MIRLTCLSFPELKILTTKIKIKTRIKEVHYKVWFVVLKIKFGFSLQNSFFLTQSTTSFGLSLPAPHAPRLRLPLEFSVLPSHKFTIIHHLFYFPPRSQDFPCHFLLHFSPQLPLNPRPPSIVFHSLSQNFFSFFLPLSSLSPSCFTLHSYFFPPFPLQTFFSDLSSPLLHTFPLCLRPFFPPPSNLPPLP